MAAESWSTVLLALGAFVLLLAGAVGVAAARRLFFSAADLPDAASLESFFGPAGQERFRPALLFDRSGTVLLAQVVHPLSADRRWVRLQDLPAEVSLATVAALDPTYWANAGYDAGAAARTLLALVAGLSPPSRAPTITERLAEQTLIGAAPSPLSATALAADIASSYAKERVLEWFLNSADYGHLAFGIDAASLVYFGKHADRLTLGEAALLAALPARPDVDALADPQAARALRDEVLEAMVRQGAIAQAEAAEARAEAPKLRVETAREAMQGLAFVEAAWRELRQRIGPGAAAQGGVRVVTTLDLDLQLQADCVLRTHLARMAGGDPTSIVGAADGSPCVAASLLPAVRPGDVGVDHGLERAAVVVLDPSRGEILALVGPADEPQPASGALEPLLYLSAFSKGYTPATMLIDGDGRGPMRLRTALTEGSSSVANQLLDGVGAQTVARTLTQLGVATEAAGLDSLERFPLRLDDLAAALGVLGQGGLQAGVAAVDGGGLEPSLILAVQRPDGGVLYRAEVDRRSLTSEGLAFLLNDILSDAEARARRYGPGNAFEVGRPAAVVTAQSEAVAWAAGYTPQRVVAVWASAERGEALSGVTPLNGATPVWQALTRYAHRDLPVAAWRMPPDVTQVDVCDPSGYLPTPYCPRVEGEVFLLGTEPAHADTFYRPFRINRETGRLATYFTPLDKIEEVVYFVPPPEAEAWAQAAGLALPPQEYDWIPSPGSPDPEVHLAAPEFFAVVAGQVTVRGTAAGDAFASYRLDAGAGLDPRSWLQIGGDRTAPARNDVLGQWDTTGLHGVYILRLTVVRENGTAETAAVPVTVDNRPPEVRIIVPADGQSYSAPEDREAAVQVEVFDGTGLDRVVIYLDGRLLATVSEAPWSVRWPLGAAGEHTIRARAYDVAGNWADSEQVTFTVVR